MIKIINESLFKCHNEFYDNLEIYEIIEFYDFPFIFTLKYTKKDKIYLQYFADEIKNKNSRIVEYYMVETNDNELKLLKENKITEFDIFKNSKDNVFVIHEEYNYSFVRSIYKLPYGIFESICDYDEFIKPYIDFDEFLLNYNNNNN